MSIPADKTPDAAGHDDFRLKAVDLVTGSLNAILLLATTLFAALIAYGANKTAGPWQWLFWVALLLLLLTGAASVATVNSLINKVHMADADGVRHREVRALYISVALLFALALICGGSYALVAETPPSQSAPKSSNTIVTDPTTTIVVGADSNDKVVIQKNAAGKIERIDVAP